MSFHRVSNYICMKLDIGATKQPLGHYQQKLPAHQRMHLNKHHSQAELFVADILASYYIVPFVIGRI
jgi:hypothetical protein